MARPLPAVDVCTRCPNPAEPDSPWCRCCTIRVRLDWDNITAGFQLLAQPVKGGL